MNILKCSKDFIREKKIIIIKKKLFSSRYLFLISQPQARVTSSEATSPKLYGLANLFCLTTDESDSNPMNHLIGGAIN